jgi:hypothetical protein
MGGFVNIVNITLVVLIAFNYFDSVYSDETTGVFTLKSNPNSLVGLERNKLESEKLYEEMNKDLILAKKPKERDYNLILQKSQELIQNYPESEAALTLLGTIDMWYSLGTVSKEQFSFFKKKLDDCNNQEDKGREIFSSLYDRYQQIIEKGNFTLYLFSELVKSCNDIIETQGVSQRFKCHALLLLLLAEIYFELHDYRSAEIYIKSIDEDTKKHILISRMGGQFLIGHTP